MKVSELDKMKRGHLYWRLEEYTNWPKEKIEAVVKGEKGNNLKEVLVNEGCVDWLAEEIVYFVGIYSANITETVACEVIQFNKGLKNINYSIHIFFDEEEFNNFPGKGKIYLVEGSNIKDSRLIL